MSVCRSCGAEIRWANTTTGARMPLDAEPEKRAVIVPGPALEPVVRIVDTFTPHFATCPEGSEWSRKGRS